MIYIDPPYNTGNDFVYEDDFADPMARYKEVTQQTTKSNAETMGRYHTNWLNMMYPRLRLAANLLADNGAIFISIDENEIANLKKLCDEIFGEENCVGCIANTNNPKGRSDDKYIATAHEYILIYAKHLDNLEWFGFEPGEEIIKRYNKTDSNGKKYREIDLRKTGENDLREDRPNLFYYFYYNEATNDFYPSRDENIPEGYIQIKPQREDGKEGNLLVVKNSSNLKRFEKIDETFREANETKTIGIEILLQIIVLTDFNSIFPKYRNGIKKELLILELNQLYANKVTTKNIAPFFVPKWC